MGDVIGDMSGTWQTDDWAIACRSCSLRMTEVAYADLPESFYRVTAGDVELWAFNRGHFEMLLRLLEGDSIEDHPYQWFATYAHGTWLEKSNRTRLAKRMRILLAETET
ncbi:hypothetical protein CGZ80_14880 [Rhodopirellula sp. MGV]|nr:hypothetical protein CGZ80_14880 [Rhodopirellula sp. MGV]